MQLDLTLHLALQGRFRELALWAARAAGHERRSAEKCDRGRPGMKLTVAAVFAMPFLLAWASAATALPQETGEPLQPPEQAMRCESSAQTRPLPALDIEVCDACNLSREEIFAAKQTFAVAAHAAGHRIDILETERVRITETGALENGMPYVKGETAGKWFRVGDPGPGETLGSIVGRMIFAILSDSRRNAH
jgi:hypothetical protein